MRRRRPRPRLPNGIEVKKCILAEGLELIWLLQRRPSSRAHVEQVLGIPHREFYRYLQALRLLKAPLTRDRNRETGGIEYSLPAWWP